MARRAKESVRLRQERIAGTSNGATLRTRVVRDRKKYTRKIKHSRKSIAEAMDFVCFGYFSVFTVCLPAVPGRAPAVPDVVATGPRRS